MVKKGLLPFFSGVPRHEDGHHFIYLGLHCLKDGRHTQ